MKMIRAVLLMGVLGAVSAQACPGTTTTLASWYGPGFHGLLTASGAIFNQGNLTAAHKSWKFGTKVRVTNIRNGRSTIVTITDRGPFVQGRDIDLSMGAARAIGISGVGKVVLRPLC